MKEWPLNFLKKQMEDALSELGADEKWRRMKMDRLETDLSRPEYVYRELAEALEVDFGVGISQAGQGMKTIFGSVLADLPEEVFIKLLKMKHVFYIHTNNPGAEVKPFQLDEDRIRAINDLQRVVVVNFPHDMISRDFAAARGTVAHELAHVYLEHGFKETVHTEDDEEEDDRLIAEWGFEAEWEATIREYESWEG